MTTESQTLTTLSILFYELEKKYGLTAEDYENITKYYYYLTKQDESRTMYFNYTSLTWIDEEKRKRHEIITKLVNYYNNKMRITRQQMWTVHQLQKILRL